MVCVQWCCCGSICNAGRVLGHGTGWPSTCHTEQMDRYVALYAFLPAASVLRQLTLVFDVSRVKVYKKSGRMQF